MRKRNNKKRTTYIILLIVIAVLVVGYATLSQVLNIFGGLSIIGGNNWGIRWDNVVINSDSTAVAVTPPVISSGGSSANNTVNFVVNLNTPGDFYEFNVDAVNYGSIDAMIDTIDYEILDMDDNSVDIDFLNCTVTYSNDIQLSSGHLLTAGETVTYKVRVEFNSDISNDELPSSEESYRFEFGVTYVQADESAYSPNERIQNMIIIGDSNGVPADLMEDLFSDNFNILYSKTMLSYINTSAGAMDFEVQTIVRDLVEEYGAENVVVVLGNYDVESTELYAETVTIGDPTFAGTLAGFELHTPVYHVFDSVLSPYYDSIAYNNLEQYMWAMYPDDLIEAAQYYRDLYSVQHNL